MLPTRIKNLKLLLQIEGKAPQPLLRIYREWQPEIRLEINGKTVTFHIQDNAAGFKNREIICWNVCRLTEKPIVIAVPDGANRVEHTFEHEGEYVIETRARRTGWGAPKELSPFDVPARQPLFRVGNFDFEKFRNQRTLYLLVVLLLPDAQTPINEDEYLATLAYMVKRNLYHRTIENWIHLFLALPEPMCRQFQTKLYDAQHQNVQAVRQKYEEKIKSIVNRRGIVSQFPINSDIEIELTASPYRQDNHDGFMLRWRTDCNVVRITNINAQNLQSEGQRFVKTESMSFYTLIAGYVGDAEACLARYKQNEKAFAISTVAIAREPLILHFQAVQLDNARFKLIWRALDAEEVEIAPLGKVKSEGEVILEPSHGQEFTLTAISREGISQQTAKTKFAPPFIKIFRIESVQNGYARLIWETLRANEARIEPNIGAVEPSGEMQLPLRKLHSLRLVAKNKAGEIEKRIEMTPDAQRAVDAAKNSPPSIEKFTIEKSGENAQQFKVVWCVSSADKVEIQPIGQVESAGEQQISLEQLFAGVKIIAINGAGKTEKVFASNLPAWFCENAFVEITCNGKTMCAKVFELRQISQKLLFKGLQKISFDILHAIEETVILCLTHNGQKHVAIAKPTDKKELSIFNL